MTLNFSRKSVLLHIGFWLLYLLLEYVANLPHLQNADQWMFIRSNLIALPVLLIPTYAVALFAVPRLLMPKKFLLFGLFVLAAAGFVFFGRIKWLQLVNYINYDFISGMPVTKVLKNVIRDYAVIALAICIYIIDDWRKREKENIKLAEEKAQSDLQLLKQQLHPHFLFNTLNNIYSLALSNEQPGNLVSQSILKLSQLMEYLVYQSGKEWVTLQEEISLVEHYIDLEVLRLATKPNIEINAEDADGKVKVAPILLLPFVENCFKHGGKTNEQPFWITIDLSTKSGELQVQIANSKGAPVDRKNHGVGLHNITERLNLLYPNNYTLNVIDTNDRFTIDLKLKWK